MAELAIESKLNKLDKLGKLSEQSKSAVTNGLLSLTQAISTSALETSDASGTAP